MNILKAVGVTAAILVVGVLIATAIDDPIVARTLIGLIVLGTSFWACVDSTKWKKYETGLPGPGVLLIGMAILWILYFPMYLAKRFAIQEGRVALKKQYRDYAASSARAAV